MWQNLNKVIDIGAISNIILFRVYKMQIGLNRPQLAKNNIQNGFVTIELVRKYIFYQKIVVDVVKLQQGHLHRNCFQYKNLCWYI